MKNLDLNSTLESFWFFDGLMILLAVFGFIIGLTGILIGGWGLWITLIMLLGEFILLSGFFLAPRKFTVKTYKHDLVANPTAWVKCILLSDLHAGPRKQSDWYEKITDKVNSLNPHLILIAGDFVIDWAREADALQPLAKMQSPHGIFFVLGNHDYLDDPQALSQKLESFNFYNLTNSHISLRIHNSELRLSGLDDVYFGKPQNLPKRVDKNPHLTLAHSPDAVLNIKEGQTDLVCCGHTHAGQVRFPFIGSLHVPSTLGKKAGYGYKIINGIPTIISKGLGEIRPRARLLCKPEIVVIELGI